MKDRYDVIVIGSGAAGFSTADWLVRFGVTDICVVTENVRYGTSRNAGSDKQTYYKLDMCSDAGDSVRKMAEDLFAGGSMDGADALIEAASSARCFMRLVEAGVPFPSDDYGRFAGYRTDHDNTERATSAGPLTSAYMTEKLEAKVRAAGTEILDGCQMIKLIVRDGVCGGVICLTEHGMRPLYAKAVILCTGAPAGIYSRSVYPECQTGATGLAVEAGAELANFQEWQYGIASVKFRWNLSGSYQQVVPRYYSVLPDGTEYEFLLNGREPSEVYSNVFLKGYQWPFDSAKLSGSSGIDMLVFEELKKGRRVFLDYTRDPAGFRFSELTTEARKYITDTGCMDESPYKRLMKLNPKAVQLYLSHGIDLSCEPLEISISAQHNNGGIRTDVNGESSVKNLFAVGEAAGKFGVYRPGGAALNDTQVGGLRAARYLAGMLGQIDFPAYEAQLPALPEVSSTPTLAALKRYFTLKMSDCTGVIRSCEETAALLGELTELAGDFYGRVTAGREEIPDFFRFRASVFAMIALCRTVLDSARVIGSRGGSVSKSNGKVLDENKEYRKYITVTSADGVSYVPVTPVPDEKIVFEKLLKKI